MIKKQFISAKKAVTTYGLLKKQVIELVRSGKVELFNTNGDKVDLKKHQLNFEECVYNYPYINFMKSPEERWEGYLRAFNFKNPESVKPIQIAFEEKLEREAIIEIEYDLIIGKYSFKVSELEASFDNTLSNIVETSNVMEEKRLKNMDFTFAIWEFVINAYKPKRKNDALPRRMKILIQFLQGVPYSIIESENPSINISDALRIAKTKDVVTLMENNQELPPLDLQIIPKS